MKKYFVYKENRYGFENKIETFVGNVPFPVYFIFKKCLYLFILSSIVTVIAYIWSNMFTYTIQFLISVFVILHMFFTFIKMMFASCRYASKDQNEAYEHYMKQCEKNSSYKYNVSDVREVDEWFMLFEKTFKEKLNENKIFK